MGGALRWRPAYTSRSVRDSVCVCGSVKKDVQRSLGVLGRNVVRVAWRKSLKRARAHNRHIPTEMEARQRQGVVARTGEGGGLKGTTECTEGMPTNR